MNENHSPAAASIPRARRRGVRTWQLIVLWLICMLPLMFWGLPTSRYDEFLFDGGEVWDAEHYGAGPAAQARRERIGGADTDLDPLAATDRVVELTADDAGRAAILLRYRLFSRQPDEMITFMALQRMNPRRFDFDPQLYQYGGGYIYLIGAAVGVSSLLGLIELSSDVGVYLTQPELFARFYIIARLVTLVFGAFTLVAVSKLARRAAGRAAGWIALALVATCPVFITGVLEAKPHLPSVCLLLWAILSALDYQARGHRRDALRMGLQVGCAFGLILTGLAGALLWPVLLLTHGRTAGLEDSTCPTWLLLTRRSDARRTGDARRTRRDLALAGGLALAVYMLTNPYIFYNVLFHRAVFWGNVDNSTAMYTIGAFSAGLLRVGQLLLESCGPGILVGGLTALAWLCLRWPRRLGLAIAPGLGMLVLCIAIGAGKPAEFARFLLLPATLFAVGTAALVATLAARHLGWGVLATIVALALMRTPAYVYSFYTDAHFAHESRHRAAQYLREHTSPSDIIGVVQLPAPYAIPPLDFARRRVWLLPQAGLARSEHGKLPEWIVLTADDATVHRDAWWQPHYRLVEQFAAERFQLSRIAWANKPVFVYRRAEPRAERAMSTVVSRHRPERH